VHKADAHCHLWADCPEKCHNPMDFHGLLQGQLLPVFLYYHSFYCVYLYMF
jgi:hypothetical protein